LRIWIDNRHPTAIVSQQLVRAWARRILRALGLPEAEISILLVEDSEIAALNCQYFKRQGPTNVIAFSMREGEGAHLAPHLLGDVVICLDTARREAQAAGIPFTHRLQALLVHGILHLLAYEHVGDRAQAQRMGREEKRLLEVIRGDSRVLRSRGRGSAK
jgi:probable rRNA maturation factor